MYATVVFMCTRQLQTYLALLASHSCAVGYFEGLLWCGLMYEIGMVGTGTGDLEKHY